MGFASIMRPDGTYDILGEPNASDIVKHQFCSSCNKWKRTNDAPIAADLLFICPECIDAPPPL